MALISGLNILRLDSPYILTRSRVEPCYYIICQRWSISIHALTLYSIFQLSDMFHLRGYKISTPIVKEQCNQMPMNSLRVHSVSIVYYASWEGGQRTIALGQYTFEHGTPTISIVEELPRFPAHKPQYCGRMRPMTTTITRKEKSLPTWMFTRAMA